MARISIQITNSWGKGNASRIMLLFLLVPVALSTLYRFSRLIPDRALWLYWVAGCALTALMVIRASRENSINTLTFDDDLQSLIISGTKLADGPTETSIAYNALTFKFSQKHSFRYSTYSLIEIMRDGETITVIGPTTGFTRKQIDELHQLLKERSNDGIAAVSLLEQS